MSIYNNEFIFSSKYFDIIHQNTENSENQYILKLFL